MLKKFIAPIFAIVLALSTLGASVGVALAKTTPENGNEGCQSQTITIGEKVNYYSGNVGVFMPASAYAGELEICRNSTLHPERTKDVGLQFVSPVMYWSVEKGENNSQAVARGSDWVQFNTPAYQEAYMKAFKSGELAIYYWNATSKIWEKLPTFATTNGFHARAANFGYYAIGRLNPQSTTQ
jgi:hypothetical protein